MLFMTVFMLRVERKITGQHSDHVDRTYKGTKSPFLVRASEKDLTELVWADTLFPLILPVHSLFSPTAG